MLILPYIKAQKWSDKNLTNLTGGGAPVIDIAILCWKYLSLGGYRHKCGKALILLICQTLPTKHLLYLRLSMVVLTGIDTKNMVCSNFMCLHNTLQ